MHTRPTYARCPAYRQACILHKHTSMHVCLPDAVHHVTSMQEVTMWHVRRYMCE